MEKAASCRMIRSGILQPLKTRKARKNHAFTTYFRVFRAFRAFQKIHLGYALG